MSLDPFYEGAMQIRGSLGSTLGCQGNRPNSPIVLEKSSLSCGDIPGVARRI
jgi:hypothetical protein